MENIDYDDIVKYIQDEIIGQKIKSSSIIVPTNPGIFNGGNVTQTVTQTISQTVIKKMLIVFGIENTKLGKDIEASTGAVATPITIIVSILAVYANFTSIPNQQSNDKGFTTLVSILGMVGTLILVSKTVPSFDLPGIVTMISTGISAAVNGLAHLAKVIGSIDGIAQSTDVILKMVGGSSIVKSGVNQISRFASFIYNFIDQMLKRPLLSSAIETIKKLVNSAKPESIKVTSQPGLIEELKEAFGIAYAKSFQSQTNSSLDNFVWDGIEGNIKYTGFGTGSFSKIITTLCDLPDKKIQMITVPNSPYPTYTIDSIESNGKSVIMGKPVPMALVICWIQTNKKSIYNKQSQNKNTTSYSFTMGPNGSVSLFDSTGKEISTMSKAIQAQLASNSKEASDHVKQVCKKLFGVNEGMGDQTCSKYFYSVLGISIEGILRLMGGVSHDTHKQIVSADLPVLYDLIKRLDWQTRLTLLNQYELITVDEWVGTPSGAKFADYIKTNVQVKNLLEQIVKKINSHPEFLNLKSQVETTEIVPKRNIRRHRAKSTVTVSRLVTLGDTLKLLTRKTQTGGAKSHPLEIKYMDIKKSLESFNQKLSSVTENKIKEKINMVIKIEKELEQINGKILSYVKLLKSNKNARLNGKIINLEEIDSMLSQYSGLTSAHNRQIATISSAFGKIQLLIESGPNLSLVPKSNNSSVYHNL